MSTVLAFLRAAVVAVVDALRWIGQIAGEIWNSSEMNATVTISVKWLAVNLILIAILVAIILFF